LSFKSIYAFFMPVYR